MSRVPQGSVLDLNLFSIFSNDFEGQIKCTVSKFTADTKLSEEAED